MSNEHPPQSAADPRPNNEPYYIDTQCPDCNTDLVLSDEHKPSGTTDALVHPDVWEDRDDTIWHDEWVCPDCESGIHMDWPDEEHSELEQKAEEAKENLDDVEDTDLWQGIQEAKNDEFARPDQDFEWGNVE